MADEELEQQQPSGHRPEGFCCSIMVGYDVCHYCKAAERSAVYAECMLTAVPSDRPSDRLSTMDDILSTTHDLATTIAAANQCACVASLWTRGSSSIERDIVAAAHRRVWGYGYGAGEDRRALSCDYEYQ